MKHVQCAGGVVIWNHRLLMIHQNQNSWSLPKGHVDPGESYEDAARREIAEESGIKELILIKKIGQYDRYKIALGGGDDRSELKTIHLYLYVTLEGTLSTPELQSRPVWMDLGTALQSLTHPNDGKFLQDHYGEISEYLHPSVVKLTTTLPTQGAAIDLATQIVQARMGACAQIDGPITSIYRWDNQIQQETEWRLAIKTTHANIDRLQALIHKNHPYDTPQLIITPILSGSKSYLKWVASECVS